MSIERTSNIHTLTALAIPSNAWGKERNQSDMGGSNYVTVIRDAIRRVIDIKGAPLAAAAITECFEPRIAHNFGQGLKNDHSCQFETFSWSRTWYRTEVIIADDMPALCQPKRHVWRRTRFGNEWKLTSRARHEFPKVELGLWRVRHEVSTVAVC